jgi:dual 3',5'-cyclic-AMP and -GMP phosphodiesterase 11
MTPYYRCSSFSCHEELQQSRLFPLVVKFPLLAGRKATRQVVDTWLVSHATPTSANTGSSVSPPVADLSSPSHQANPAPTSGSLPANTAPSSRAGSGATTPVRKISAHEFERGGLLKPIVNTIDGTPTFLSVSPTGDCSATCTSTNGPVGSGGTPLHPGPGRPQRRSRHELRHLDEKELIFELVGSALLCGVTKHNRMYDYAALLNEP